jgi:hypothetical protein
MTGIIIAHRMNFDAGCALIESALTGPTRAEIVADAAASRDFERALVRLRDHMRANIWPAAAQRINLERIVNTFDRTTRHDGFHVLHDWDGKADRVNEDTIPVDVLNYVMERRGAQAPDARGLSILLDYYFFHILALFSLRIWDEGDADANLDRLGRLLAALQGPDGSGQPFAANAETLILIATSHFELQERGYDKLLARVRTLNEGHRTAIALGHAGSMGCHLRFGFEATYRRDTLVMRRDNLADYPWLCFALATLMQEYSRRKAGGVADEGDAIAEGILNGVSADARAFVGDPPPVLSTSEQERAAFRERFLGYRADLLGTFERFRPSERRFSPLSFFFNFSHNVLKGIVIDALLRGEVWTSTFNDLLTANGEGAPKERLATTLMGYARASPDTINGRPTPVIVYDPESGREAFGVTMRKLKE